MATVKQNRYLWAFEVRNSTTPAINWTKLDLPVQAASDLIKLCAVYEKDKASNTVKESTTCAVDYAMQRYSFNFNLKPIVNQNQEPETKTIVKEIEVIKEIEVEVIKEITKTVTITDDMTLDTIIETIYPFVKGAAIIKDIYEAKLPEPQQFNTKKNYFKPDNFDLIASVVKTGAHVLIKGPAGSGKTMLCAQIAAAFEIPFFCFSCSEGMKYGHVYGADELYTDPTTQQTVSRFKLSRLMEEIQKPGLILMDEMFALEPGLLMGLNGLFEPSTRQIETKGGLVAMHKDCLIMAATNTDGRNLDRSHIGAKKVDGSSLDRFVTFYFGYSEQAEKGILNQLPTKPRKFIAETLTKFRKDLELNNIAFSASTRRLSSCVKLCLHGINPIDAFTACFTGQLSQGEIKKLNLDNLTYTI